MSEGQHSAARDRFPVVLLWHMHQPQYRDALSGVQVLPWTWLHVIKDYSDMAAHLEAVPQARAVVNFTPVLLEQIEDLAAQLRAHLERGQALPDTTLAMLADVPLAGDGAERLRMIDRCLRAHPLNLIARYPTFERLAALGRQLLELGQGAYVNDQYLRDLAMWFHLAWFGETLKREDARLKTLLQQEGSFGVRDRRAVLTLIAEQLAGVLPRYRRLAERGQIELSVTPYAHPILPLLLDLASAREAMPGAPLPAAGPVYPGGAERARWHMERGQAVFERVFGRRARGCWPAEGAVSEAATRAIDQAGFEWLASGGAVLQHSLAAVNDEASGGSHAQAWQIAGQNLQCFFRHDALSDLIGFGYSKWHGDDAVRHFVEEVERQAQAAREAGGGVLLIALDGENAWEHYPFNGYYFLRGLYGRLAEHPRLALTTLSDFIAQRRAPRPLSRLVAGSWVHGTLATWIGERDKNRGWDLLIAAKQAVDAAFASQRFSTARRAAIEQQLAQCESSDWFWWFGDYNPPVAVRDFDNLYRHQLSRLYELLGESPPDNLAQVISVGRGTPEGGGAMRRAQD